MEYLSMFAKAGVSVKSTSSADVRWLPTTSYIVMGLLSFGSRLTGYEIRQWALESTRFFWSAPAMSQIYRELERLQDRGYVDQFDESGDHERARTTYDLTDAGLAELRRWTDEAPFEPPTIRHPTAFRVFLGHIADRERLRELVQAERAWAETLLSELSEVEAGLAASGDAVYEHALTVARWGQRFYGAERTATSHVLTSLGDR